ncbi:uncharacterized protein N7443_009701 [Penicillium atrosanguineum]|uniref:uncharacterized protein n=1 Tax=Penicillium atrosanguineum TaxID=1132637 RepID=UPI00239D2FC8|nr:uncharacterized protein N7443_009701 [Penicillium atrosanguineum]KAJ5289448.1 hypothetical protein N7443_009701 [Penicillium atrosanguineum]
MTTKSALYPGETLDTIAGYPTIYNYQPSTQPTTKPLIVCIPGGVHLARIYYGGHSNSSPQDFLAHHLNNHGFNVLSLSYPLESTPSIMPPTAPNFSISDWGRQAATAAKKIISEHALPLSVVLIGWSMGGRILVPFTVSAKELGLSVEQFISFAATPGISGIRPNLYVQPTLGEVGCTRKGYMLIPERLGNFAQQISEMEGVNGGGIISKDVYLEEYVGGTPIRLMGLRLRLNGDGRSFVLDEVTHEEDSRVWDFANCPLVSALCPTGAMDASHAMADIATWGFILTYQLEGLVGKQGLAKVKETGKWEKLLGFVRDAPRRLCWSVEGNHFFFVGEKAAGEVADKVSKLIDEAAMFRRELDEILS